jgi:methanogenic corrinoid protein MtbC1
VGELGSHLATETFIARAREQVADVIGADAYAEDAADGVKKMDPLLGR